MLWNWTYIPLCKHLRISDPKNINYGRHESSSLKRKWLSLDYCIYQLYITGAYKVGINEANLDRGISEVLLRTCLFPLGQLDLILTCVYKVIQMKDPTAAFKVSWAFLFLELISISLMINLNPSASASVWSVFLFTNNNKCFCEVA